MTGRLARPAGAVLAAVIVIAAGALTAAPAAARDGVGSRCTKVGATMGVPNGTLVCARVGGRRVWTRMKSGTAKPGAAPSGAACATTPAARFTHAPVRAADIARITNGAETNDPRFAYVWPKQPGTAVPIYAPADGVLTTIRHVTSTASPPTDDYQLEFTVPGGCGDLFRFNHVTDPRPDIKAAYRFGSQCSSCFDATGAFIGRYEERERPGTAVAVKAGELLGTTTGTNLARNFDMVIQFRGATMCPMEALAEPHRSALMSLLGPGPKSGRPEKGPVAGYPCTGYGAPN